MRLLLLVILMMVSINALRLNWVSSEPHTRDIWQKVVVPGPISKSHASLSNNCAVCHQPVKGVNSSACISCHADDKALLQRQPTAFHANIQTCTGCHSEHQGGSRMPTTMDHTLLIKVGHLELRKLGDRISSGAISSGEIELLFKSLGNKSDVEPRNEGEKVHINEMPQCASGKDCGEQITKFALHARSGNDEKLLNCVACHAINDKHQQFFGNSCAQCHVMDTWAIANFRHPSLRSTECAQCHQPPPSHSMEHFSMVSQPIASQLTAQVNQCYLCHQSTSWNDIKGAGWVKHH